MRQKERIAELEREVEFVRTRYSEEVSDLKEKLREQNEELTHFRVAVSAIKWLLKKAEEQPEFQL